MRTRAYDFRSFVSDGRLVPIATATGAGGLIVQLSTVTAQAATTAASAPGSIDHAFDPVIHMLQQMSFPVASIVIIWACLRAMTGQPAQAVDQAKWAVAGYVAMRYAPELLRHI